MLVEGAVQKGPFLVGSSVWINRLDSRGKSTGSTFRAQIKDSIGSFSFEIDGTGPVLLEATGYYFSELTGQISNGMLTLRGIYEVDSDAHQVAYVNILTHLINDRVLKLISGGQVTLHAAIRQAEDELIAALSGALVIPNLNEFSALSVYDSTTAPNNSLGNAYLLALSTGLYKYAQTKSKEFNTATDAELTLVLNRLSGDLADDGHLQPGPFIGEFVTAIRSLSPEMIAANLRSRSLVDYPRGLGVPDVAVFLNLCAGTSECPWRAGAPMPLSSTGHGTAVHDGKVYVFGGMPPLSSTGNIRKNGNEVDAYDPVANDWTRKHSMPDTVYMLAAHTIGDKIYVIAGSDVVYQQPRSEVYAYDPSADQWSTKARRPIATNEFASAAVGGLLYVIGGRSDTYGIETAVQIYDPAADRWSAGAPLPIGATYGNACAVGDEIYVFAGRTVGALWDQSVFAYSTTTNTWSVKAPMPNARFQFGCAVVDGKIYLVGGYTTAYAPINEVEVYDPFVETWSSPTRLRTPRHRLSATALGKLIITMGGQADAPGSNTTKVYNVVETLDTAKL